MWEQNEISVQFEFRWKNICKMVVWWNGQTWYLLTHVLDVGNQIYVMYIWGQRLICKTCRLVLFALITVRLSRFLSFVIISMNAPHSNTVHLKNSAHGLCFVEVNFWPNLTIFVWLSIHQHWVNRLPQSQWNNPKGYREIMVMNHSDL